MMGNCKDCKHWDRDSTCNAVGDVERRQKVVADDFAIFVSVSDDSGLWYGLKTGPLFGCVKFEQKHKKGAIVTRTTHIAAGLVLAAIILMTLI